MAEEPSLTKGNDEGFTVPMSRPSFSFPDSVPLVVGSIGDFAALEEATPESLARECDIAEIRLDLFHAEFGKNGASIWQHLLPFPLLFTARCHEEGSPFNLNLELRTSMLRASLPDACLIDIEAISTVSMAAFIAEISSVGIPWIASYHDFEQLPSEHELARHLEIAKESGASVFKAAARLHTPEEMAALAHFQMADCGIPLATMGMGVLAPVSRLLCAQAGSVLNYGFIGKNSTAPGQWSAQRLRECIRSLQPLR
jgi:3-dehydroquinate dehydratase I